LDDGQTGEIRRSALRFIAGGPDDPRRGYGLCLNCPGKTVHYQEATRTWVYDDGSSHTGHLIELLPDTPNIRSHEKELVDELGTTAPKVIQRITDAAYYYRAGDVELGPFTARDEQDPKFDANLAGRLGVEPKEILRARLKEVTRPTTFSEIGDVLGSTVRHDMPGIVIRSLTSSSPEAIPRSSLESFPTCHLSSQEQEPVH